MANSGGRESADRRTGLVWICLEGLDRGMELERAVRDAGFGVGIAPDDQRLVSRFPRRIVSLAVSA